MPRDLFGDVVVRPASSRTRRSPLLLLSLGVHGVALLLGVIGSLVATGALPSPRRALAYQAPMFTVPAVDIELPSGRASARPSRPASAPMPTPTRIEPAPFEAPHGIAPENPASDGNGVSDEVARIEKPGKWSLDGLVPGTQLRPALAVVEHSQPIQEPIRLHSGIRAPQKVFAVDPAYPAMARTARVEGVVILEATIDTSGSVTGLRVLRPVALLDRAAMDAVRQWRFTPALLNDKPIAVIMTITVRFTLGGEQR
jgi:protein TonB